jgi:hypothetical protein
MMKHMTCNAVGIVVLFGLMAYPAGAQSQAPAGAQDSASGTSLGDYARQVRKDPGTTAKPKVFDNDNLPRQDKLSIVGQPSAPDASNSGDAKAAQTDNATPAGADSKTSDSKAAVPEKAPLTATKTAPQYDEQTKQAALKQWNDKLAAQKDQIDLMARELDVVQREYQIRAAAMYADAGNRMRNSGEWDKQDAQYKQQIADKQKSLDEAKQKLEDLQEEARKAGVPSSVSEQ